MANWITHLMVADSVLQKLPWLDRRGFCVGNIALDCNVENEDWTAFTPSREITHWTVKEESLQPIEKYISITPDEVKAFAAAAVAIVTKKIGEIGERK